MANGNYIAYLRVSTQKQGHSGLGLEAQRSIIQDYLSKHGGNPLAEFVEIESGKGNGKNRPQLARALNKCRLTGSTLIIARLDRLGRNLHFISSLMESQVDFRCCDFPEGSKLTLHIMASIAEYEATLISKRTREGLAAAKARGVKLGNPQNLTLRDRITGSFKGVQVKIDRANAFAESVFPLIKPHRDTGASLRQIADILNKSQVITATGKVGCWRAQTVKNIISRVGGKP